MPEKNKFGKYEEADFDIAVPEDEDTPGSSISKKDKMKKYSQDIVKLLENMTLNAYKFFENVDLNEMVETNNNNPENKRLLNFNNINNLGLVSQMKIPIDEDYVIDDKNNLDLYSPKFCKILKNLFDNENNGCHLLYSNFRTLEGIGLLKIVLDYYGYSEFKLKKTNDGTEKIYQVQIDNKFYNHSCFSSDNNNGDNKNLFSTLSNRNLYALYTGKEDAEEKEIIRNVFNGNFEKIPVSVKNDIKKYFFNNNEDTMTNKFGEIIKLFMISSSGAEGIDLKNVKFVHIMEPYWHPGKN